MAKFKMYKENYRPKVCKEGFSWWTVFFGPLVPLTRGMRGTYVAKVWVISAFTLSLANIYFAFKMNRDYFEHLLDEGWTRLNPQDPRSGRPPEHFNCRCAVEKGVI